MNKKILSLEMVLFLVLVVNGLFCLAQGSDFEPSHQVNRVKASTHYFFSLFEKNPRDADAVVAVLASDGFELKYPWGKFTTPEAVKKWIRGIPNDFQDAHHIQDMQVEVTENGNATAVVGIIWQNIGPQGEVDSDRLIYTIEFREEGTMLPKIKRLHCEKLERN